MSGERYLRAVEAYAHAEARRRGLKVRTSISNGRLEIQLLPP